MNGFYSKIIFMALIIVASRTVLAQPIAVISSDVPIGYDLATISGEEACLVDVSFVGRNEDRRRVVLDVKSPARRVCPVCNETDCVMRRIDPPSQIEVHFNNRTRYRTVDLELGRYDFIIPHALLRRAGYLRIGNATIMLQSLGGYNATTNNTQIRYGTVGEPLTSRSNVFLTHNITSYWGNLRYYFAGDEQTAEGNGSIGSCINSYDRSINVLNGSLCVYGVNPISDYYTSSIYGRAWNFSGSSSNSYLSLGSQDSLTYIGSNFTIMFWFYQQSDSTDVAQRYIIRKGITSSNVNTAQNYRISTRGNGGWQMIIGNGTTSQSVWDANLTGPSQGRWVHLAFTVNSSRQWQIYYNGNNQTNASGVTETLLGHYALDNFTIIGSGLTTLSTQAIRGLIDELMILNQSMTQAEIQEIYNNRTNRYPADGTLLFQNINLSGNNTVSVQINNTRYFETNLTVQMNDGTQQALIGNNTGYFNVTGDLQNANLTVYFKRGNYSDYFFYTPNIFYDILIESQDTQGLFITNLTEYPSEPVTYHPSTQYHFNATIIDPSLASVWFQFNNANYTPVFQGNDIWKIGFVGILPGNYTYYWGAIDTAGVQVTAQGSYNITLVPYQNFSGSLCLVFKDITRKPALPRINLGGLRCEA